MTNRRGTFNREVLHRAWPGFGLDWKSYFDALLCCAAKRRGDVLCLPVFLQPPESNPHLHSFSRSSGKKENPNWVDVPPASSEGGRARSSRPGCASVGCA